MTKNTGNLFTANRKLQTNNVERKQKLKEKPNEGNKMDVDYQKVIPSNIIFLKSESKSQDMEIFITPFVYPTLFA